MDERTGPGRPEDTPFVHPFLRGLPADRAWVAAHRGGSHQWPENTVYAFERALEAGVHMLEMDVRLAADGVPVIIHDAMVDRTTNGRGPVRAFTFGQLRRLDAAYSWSSPAEPGSRPYRDGGMTGSTGPSWPPFTRHCCDSSVPAIQK